MFDIDFWREVFQSVNKNRLRSVLSGFTVAFAIMLFAILFGIANGLKNNFDEAFNDDANNAIFIRSGRTTKASKGLQAGREIQFKNEDFSYIKAEYEDKIQFQTARVYKSVSASFQGEKGTYSVRAVHPDHQYLEKTIIMEGRYLNQNDINQREKVIVIGRLVAEDLFIREKPLGQFLNLSGITYKVIGVFKDEGSENEERNIYMPVTTAQQVYGNNDFIDEVNLTYNPELNFDQAIGFSSILLKDLKERFFIDKDDQSAVRVRNLADENKAVNQMTSVLGVIIIIIGLGTLIAGIVGISNIMIFIVKERTKEIGIRKALGASPRSIVSIILTESVIITIIAGYLGLLIGTIVLNLSKDVLEPYFIKDPSVPTSLVITATVILILAGGLAGYLPAKKASQIKPIVALRDD